MGDLSNKKLKYRRKIWNKIKQENIVKDFIFFNYDFTYFFMTNNKEKASKEIEDRSYDICFQYKENKITFLNK